MVQERQADMKTRYFVLIEAKDRNPVWNTFGGAFDCETAALDEAARCWKNLTEYEKENRIITVCRAEVEKDEDLYDSEPEVIKEFKLLL